MLDKIKVAQMLNDRGRAIPNQFRITTPQGEYFQSYNSIIAYRDFASGKITLDKNYWDYSTTTGKYRNYFLGEKKPETEKKIESGVYVLDNLN